jgi:hypothetical protein
MSKAMTLVVAVMVVAVAMGMTGCASIQVKMNPEALVDEHVNKRQIQSKIILFMDREFQNYHWQGFSGGELRTLDYDLGTASKNLFIKAFTLVSKDVSFVESMPTYSAVHDRLVLVVHPRIAGFSEKHNPFIRNADYYAEITYHVTVYNRAGKVVLEKDYSANGVEMGGMSVYRNYAAPAETAMVRAIVKIIDDMSKLKEP